MNFASLTFWVALIAGFLVLSLLRLGFKKSPLFDSAAFLTLSLFLLGIESWQTVAIFGWVSLAGYIGLHCRHRWQLWLTGILILAPLSYYKYGGFIAEIFSGKRELTQALIPMGISFYSFQILSFIIDSYREKLEKPKFIDYLNYASFFPQIVAGPIERRKDLLPQVKKLRFTLQRNALEVGIPWIVLGLFMKLALAENLALIDLEMKSKAVNAVQVWLEAVFFAFRIYFDFAGYSLIALGLAKCLGIQLTLNFRSPYLTVNLQEFWRHWHVTLSQWFRDYIYFPMGGSRVKFWILNVLIVFLISGLWHGAGWNFLIWGGLHGLGVSLCAYMGQRKFPRIISWVITMTFVTFAWIFFKEPTWEAAWTQIELITNPSSYHLSPNAILKIFSSPKAIILMVMMIVLILGMMLGEFYSLRKGEFYGVFLNRWIQLIMIAGIFLLAPANESGFIYFNF